jgi:NarL family two-component system sensor histidine kinase LiaS
LERQVNERTREIEQLFEKTKELAILEERNRLARDLHDSAKQKAFAALAQLGAARSLTGNHPEKATRHVQEAETLVGEVIQEITFLIQELHPIALREKGLAAELREYVFEWGNRTGIEVDLQIDLERRLPLHIEQSLYRIIQEALANIARHSNARAVRLTLALHPGQVNVSISDNGQGFDPQNQSEGMGLRSIHERVDSISGTFNLRSSPGEGTQLEIQVPIKD